MESTLVTPSSLSDPVRIELHNELHARPSLYFDGDTDVWHVAITSETMPAIPSGLRGLDDVVVTQDGRHGIGRLDGGRLKWELHTEFLSLTFVKSRGDESSGGALPSAFQHLFETIGGRIIAAAHVQTQTDRDDGVETTPQGDYVASTVGGGDAEVHSTFQLGESGFVEFLLINRNLNAYRTGRMVRRLLEIETYRMMALLAVPIAKEINSKLPSFDGKLTQIIEHMQRSVKVDKDLLSEVTLLSSDVLTLSAVARRRLGATKAYSEIVASRLSELREGRVEQRQRLGTFIDRRFQPAVRSCAATERRLDELAERVKLTGDLLRTTVQVQLEDQNASLLASMAERARIQVHIQQAVEGFSVIAITYYTLGLLKICLESLGELGLAHEIVKIIMLAAVPLVAVAVWQALRRVRKVIFDKAHS